MNKKVVVFEIVFLIIAVVILLALLKKACDIEIHLVSQKELQEVQFVEETQTKAEIVENEYHVSASDYSFIEEITVKDEMLEEFTQNELDLMARVVMSESSIEPYECKMLVAKTVLNRYYSDNFPDSVQTVVEKGFSTQDNGEVTEECYNAVYDAFISTEPVMYFRTDYYHSFGTPYKQVGITCFSTEREVGK